MKKTISIIALFISFVSSVAHPGFVRHNVQSGYLFQEEMSPSYLLADEVILRKEPNTQSTALDVFAIGTKMYLLDRSIDTFKVNGIESHWYKVKIEDQLGWIWGGFIAQQAFGSTSDPSVKFVGGMSRSIQEKGSSRYSLYYQIRAFRDGKQLDKIEIKSFAWGFGYLQNLGNKGLAEVGDILSIHIPCVGGCGCLTGDIYVFWSHNQFHHVLDLTGTPDGSYSEGSYFIFPSDMEGKRGHIIKVSSYVKEEPKNVNGKITREVKKVYYRWNGSKLVEGDIEPVVYTYLMEE